MARLRRDSATRSDGQAWRAVLPRPTGWRRACPRPDLMRSADRNFCSTPTSGNINGFQIFMLWATSGPIKSRCHRNIAARSVMMQASPSRIWTPTTARKTEKWRISRTAMLVIHCSSPASSTSTTNVENIQHRAIRCRLARASGHRPRQQALKFLQVVEFGPNVFKVMRGNLADLTT